MAANNEGVVKAVVNFYQDDSDSESYDLRPYILQVQILIGLLFGNVGLWQERMILQNVFVEESNTRLVKWRAT